MADSGMRVWTWAVLGPAGKRVWTLLFACYYLDARGISRPDALLAEVVAADGWHQEKDRHPDLVAKQTVRAGQVPSGGWLQPPPASVLREDVPSSAVLSDKEYALVRGGAWEAFSAENQEALVLKLAVMQHLAEFNAAPTDLVAEAERAAGS